MKSSLGSWVTKTRGGGNTLGVVKAADRFYGSVVMANEAMIRELKRQHPNLNFPVISMVSDIDIETPVFVDVSVVQELDSLNLELQRKLAKSEAEVKRLKNRLLREGFST